MKTLPLWVAMAALVGCTTETMTDSRLTADDTGRAAVGRAAPYQADPLDSKLLSEDMKARRAAGWKVLMKSVESVPLAGAPSRDFKIPKFLTWYDRGEFAPLAKSLYGSGAARNGGFSDDDIENAFATTFKPQTLDPELFSPDPMATAGMTHHSGTGRTLFSESMLKHYLKFADRIVDCVVTDDFEPTATSFSPCMEEFPADAVMIKARWQPVLEGRVTTKDFDTGAEHFEDLFSNPDTFDGIASQPLEIGVDQAGIFQVQDRSGQKWALEAIHIVTKEVRDWVWATYWWSDTPNDDFGADRPSGVTGVWQNYKMCVQTTFHEKDGDVGSGLPESLANALEATTGPRMHTPAGEVAGWCANPYIEGPFPDATCIGCHQAAGGGLGQGNDPAPDGVFPGDFSFAFSSFKRMLQTAEGAISIPPHELTFLTP